MLKNITFLKIYSTDNQLFSNHEALVRISNESNFKLSLFSVFTIFPICLN
jgi:hypothetical protein